MKTYLFNPFKYIAGAKALVIGWAIMLITACIAWYSKLHFNGVIDAHYGMTAPFGWYFLDAAIAWACAVIPFYVAARLLSRSSTRLIDMAGTLALARAPMFFVALLFLAMPPAEHLRSVKNLHDIDSSALLISLVVTVFIIWMIALMYNAFSVSSNIRGRKATWIFIAGIVIAEALSMAVFYPLYAHMV